MQDTLFSHALHRLMHAYKRQLRAGIQRHRISLPITHLRALKGICRVPGSNAQSIAQSMDADKAQITRVLGELKQSGLIDKSQNPVDRRSLLLVPTEAGKRTFAKIERVEKQAADRMTRGLSAAEIEAFVRIAESMIENAADDLSTGEGTAVNG